MVKLLLSVLVNGFILFLLSDLLPYNSALQSGIQASGGWELYCVGGLILGLLNTVVRPILSILSFPFFLLTFGLFSLVINGVILWLFGIILPSLNLGIAFQVHSALSFAIASVLLWILNLFLGLFTKIL